MKIYEISYMCIITMITTPQLFHYSIHVASIIHITMSLFRLVYLLYMFEETVYILLAGGRGWEL